MVTTLELIAKFWQPVKAVCRWLCPFGLAKSKLLRARDLMRTLRYAQSIEIDTPEMRGTVQAGVLAAMRDETKSLGGEIERPPSLAAVVVRRLVAAARLPQLKEPAQEPDELQEGGKDADK
jgi:hypothetical protein